MRAGGRHLSSTLIKALTSGWRIAMGGHPMSTLTDTYIPFLSHHFPCCVMI
jgi:hypothetical protein